MQEANTRLREELVRHQDATTKAIEDMMAQAMTTDAVSMGEAPQIRGELTEALDRFERSRHEARLAIFAFLGTVPGVSTARIGRALGISRQLASRLAREASEDQPGTAN